MITFKKFGKEVKISNADWKKLKARFSPHNARAKRDTYVIEKECPLCTKYNKHSMDRCEGCPFDVFGNNFDMGCVVFFEQLFPDMKFNTDNTQDIYWDKSQDLEAREQLYELEDMIAKIEVSQGGK